MRSLTALMAGSILMSQQIVAHDSLKTSSFLLSLAIPQIVKKEVTINGINQSKDQLVFLPIINFSFTNKWNT